MHFRVWAPAHAFVQVEMEDERGASRGCWPLLPEADGHHSGSVDVARTGDRYRFRLGADGGRHPDPASRFQPAGPRGPSEIVDPSAYEWRDRHWHGVTREHTVICEMHIGTFTRDGTWAAAEHELPALADTGITVLELMPVADFPGRFGWGYDGVNLFAPTRLYGTPDDMRRFVDRAHALGMAVILDVVYNHLGPDGNFLPQFAPAYHATDHRTEWGAAINFDGDDSGPVRELYLANASYWIDEYHLDGLRLDATQSIRDQSPTHILREIGTRARAAARGRTLLLIAENEPQDVRMLRPASTGGYALDAAWNDDFHHTAHVALTGHAEAYYSDYGGTPQELVSAARRSYLYQGQYFTWQKKRRGTSTAGFAPSRFVHYLENHDQIANSADGRRLHELVTPGRLRAMTALLLLGPQIPMLFQGQEFASSAPFLYFADHHPELAAAVREGRREFLSQFSSLGAPDVAATLPHPDTPDTFERCRLDHRERSRNTAAVALHRDLLRLRRDEPAIRAAIVAGVDGAVLGESAFVLRYPAGQPGHERLLMINLGPALTPGRAPEPLLAPPNGHEWRIAWSSDAAKYGGAGESVETGRERWRLPAEIALFLAPVPCSSE